MNQITFDQLQSQLLRLKLTQMADQFDPLAQQAAKEGWTYLDFLAQLLETEIAARYARDVTMKTKLAHFPFAKS